MIKYLQEIDKLQKRVDVATRQVDWGLIWDTLKEMHATMNAQELFQRDCGTREEFIKKCKDRELYRHV